MPGVSGVAVGAGDAFLRSHSPEPAGSSALAQGPKRHPAQGGPCPVGGLQQARRRLYVRSATGFCFVRRPHANRTTGGREARSYPHRPLRLSLPSPIAPRTGSIHRSEALSPAIGREFLPEHGDEEPDRPLRTPPGGHPFEPHRGAADRQGLPKHAAAIRVQWRTPGSADAQE